MKANILKFVVSSAKKNRTRQLLRYHWKRGGGGTICKIIENETNNHLSTTKYEIGTYLVS